MTSGDVQIRDGELRVHVGGRRRSRCTRLVQIEALRAVQQTHLAEAGSRLLVARVLRERLLVRGDRGGVVARLDRVECGLVQRGKRLLDRLPRPPRPRLPPGRVPVTPCCAATSSSCANTARTCSSGTAPVNSGTGWPATSATTIGIDCARKPCASCGFASTSTFASTRRPASSVTTFSSTGPSCLHGPHHSAHRSTTTGTLWDSSRICPNVASVTSTTSGVACPRVGRVPRPRRGRPVAQRGQVDGAAQGGGGHLGHLISVTLCNCWDAGQQRHLVGRPLGGHREEQLHAVHRVEARRRGVDAGERLGRRVRRLCRPCSR